MSIPLAERLRPRTLDDYIGQEHLVGGNGVFRKFLETGNVPSFILWGPPGVGKTTLAKIVATELKRPFFTLSAVTSGVKDVREVIESARKQHFFNTPPPILFIDEIHRFNKSQQDSLLGAVEQGVVTLVGATTENPSFEVISPLLSRCQVYILRPMEDAQLQRLLDRAIATDPELRERGIDVRETEALFRFSGGDARKLLNILDILLAANEGRLTITDRLVTDCLQQNIALYDKNGEQHYDVISAFIKSVRGSDPNAAIYYLARMLAGGEEPRFIARRLVILASEDIGLANPNALLLANACFDTVHKIGMPEARIPLAEATIYLATSPKSNSAYMAINKALSFVEHDTTNRPVPLHLRNADQVDGSGGLRQGIQVRPRLRRLRRSGIHARNPRRPPFLRTERAEPRRGEDRRAHPPTVEGKILNPMLKTAAVLNFLLAAGHVLCLFRLDAAFRLYRIEPFMDRLAALWPPIPYLITLGVACGLTVCGLYALSAAGAIRPLPLLRPAVYAIGAVFALRGLAGFAAMSLACDFRSADLAAAVVAGAIGALCLAGGRRAFQTSRT